MASTAEAGFMRSVEPTGYLRRADELHLAGQYGPAIEEYRRALAGDESLLAAWYGLGCASLKQRAYGEAATALRRAVTLCVGAHGARCNLAEALFQLGEVDAAVAEYRSAAHSTDPEIRAVALAGIAVIAPGAAACDNRAIRAARQNWAGSQGYAARVERSRASSGKLRVGYLSRFFGACN